jgi:hypothetical protein
MVSDNLTIITLKKKMVSVVNSWQEGVLWTKDKIGYNKPLIFGACLILPWTTGRPRLQSDL